MSRAIWTLIQHLHPLKWFISANGILISPVCQAFLLQNTAWGGFHTREKDRKARNKVQGLVAEGRADEGHDRVASSQVCWVGGQEQAGWVRQLLRLPFQSSGCDLILSKDSYLISCILCLRRKLFGLLQNSWKEKVFSFPIMPPSSKEFLSFISFMR